MPFDENSVVLFPLHEQEIKVLQYHVSQIWPKTNKQTNKNEQGKSDHEFRNIKSKISTPPHPLFFQES